jgi:translation initiation factor IF-1
MTSGEELTATVVELLPHAVYRVELESRQQVLAHAAGARVKNFVRIRPGDRVRVELSAHDPGRGRITKVLKGGL